MTKYIFSRPRVKVWRLGMIIISAIVLVFTLVIWFMLQPTDASDKNGVFIEVVKNETGTSIIDKLKTENLIRSKLAFKFYTKFTGNTHALKPGYYKFYRSEDTVKIAQKLFSGSVYTMTVTIPEGYTILDIANRLEETKLVKKADFLEKVKDMERWKTKYPFLKDWKAKSLEGFMFPDTYDIVTSEDISYNLIDLMLKNFSNKALPLFANNKEPLKTLTMASIVERESVLEKEKPIIASVFYNRVKREIPLQSCATVDYALGKHTTNRALTIDETKTQSPYNTYMHKGLPPAPISNPGVSSILATLKPEKTNYLFFVAKGDGTSIFTTNERDHIKAMKQTTLK